jgi:hypothetical protein
MPAEAGLLQEKNHPVANPTLKTANNRKVLVRHEMKMGEAVLHLKKR